MRTFEKSIAIWKPQRTSGSLQTLETGLEKTYEQGLLNARVEFLKDLQDDTLSREELLKKYQR